MGEKTRETRVIELHAEEWFEIAGRGKVAVCKGMPPGVNHPAELLGETVTIDGSAYLVRGTEQLGGWFVSGPYSKPYGLLVKEITSELPDD